MTAPDPAPPQLDENRSQPGRTRRPWVQWVILGLILLYVIGFRAALLPLPFYRNSEGTGSFFGILARNYSLYGLGTTKGLPIQGVGVDPAVEPLFYANHPPLVPWLVAGSYALFGEGDWQTRLPTALFTVACVVGVFVILRNRGRPGAGLIAAALLATVPMTLTYGGHPDVINPTLVFFCLLTLAAYQQLHARPTLWRLAGLGGAFLLAALSDWPAFFLVPILCLHYAFTQPLRRWGWIIGFGLIACVVFAGLYVQMALVLHDWNFLVRKVAQRSLGGQTDRAGEITFVSWWTGILKHNRIRHTWPVLIVGFGWLLGRSWRRASDDRADKPAITFARLLFAWALLHIAVSHQAVLVHEWWWWPMTAALVVAGGLLLDDLREWLARRIPPHVSGAAIAMLLVAFGTWTALRIWPEFHGRMHIQGLLNYDVVEMGQAIQMAAPLNEAVVVAYDDLHELQLWYYGNRPLKLQVWDQYTLADRMTDGYADACWGYKQFWSKPPAGLVFPRDFIDNAPDFVAYLREHYPMKETAKFLIFDLTTERP